ncbi:hypothetical protein FPQ18DRAFT_418351 [Pyronema domesticum]|nr:hypothetical protein FPQ18DRAFT_418351 [Pyronema domesticum]
MEWVMTRTNKSKAYIPREKTGIRKQLRHEKKEVASWFYQLLTGHAVISPYLKEKLKKSDSDICWWCESGRRQTRNHLFKECAKWRAEIKNLWRMVGKDVGWRRAKWKPVSKLVKEERAERAILEYIRRTGVGKKNGTRVPRADDEISVDESEG